MKIIRKLAFLFVFTFCMGVTFAQNVKPYVVDLSKLPAVNDDKTATFDKASRTITVKSAKGNRGLSVRLGEKGLDISNYNIIRVKYKVTGDAGFIFVPSYDDTSVPWDDRVTYCPSYLTEMVIPLIPGQKRIKDIWFSGMWDIDYQQFVLKEVTFENVSNPVKTDIRACDEPPVIDTAKTGKFDDAISAWDYTKKLGAGFNYNAFLNKPIAQDYGLDFVWSLNFSTPKKEAVLLFKNAGFKMLRLQTSPQNYMVDENYTIDPRYIKRIKQFVDWIIEEDMYVIICGPSDDYMDDPEYMKRYENDIHVAGYNVSEKYKKSSEKFLQAIWKQYAQTFNNSYDEHLMFELLNEPVDRFHEHNFGERTDCSVCKKDYVIMNEYNQLMVDTIRSTGGNNAKRFILVGGLGEGGENITTNLFKMPKDKVKDRLIPTFHFYPLGFSDDPALGHKVYYTDSIKKSVEGMFNSFEKVYFKKHIPVIITETCGGPLTNPVLERINYMKDIMAEATKEGRSCAVCIYWGEDYKNHRADFDPWNLKWNAPSEYLNTIVYGTQGKEYPLNDAYIKENEVKAKVASIVGKNLLDKPVEMKKWDNVYKINPSILVRSVPSSYKLEFIIEKTGPKPILQVGFDDSGKWVDLSARNDVKVTGAVKGGNFEVKSETVVISVNEKLAADLEASRNIILNGENIIIKSVKVVE